MASDGVRPPRGNSTAECSAIVMGSRRVEDGQCSRCKDEGVGPLRRIEELPSGERGFPVMPAGFERTQVRRCGGLVWCRYQVCGCSFEISFDEYGRPCFENLR